MSVQTKMLRMFIFTVALINSLECQCNLTELDLHRELFLTYNANVMPNRNRWRQLDVTLDMYLMSVDSIDAKRQTISLKGFLEITWTDEYLQWNLDDYPGLNRINVKTSDIWIPDIALEDTFDQITDLGQDGGQADVKNDGKVTIWPYKIYTVACKILITDFPFDKQRCKFDFLSWTNPSSALALGTSQSKPSLYYYSESGEWALQNTSVAHERRPYGKDYWDHLIFTFELKRKSLYQIMNVMLPVFCISILNIACFLLPSDEGERVTLAISIFLTLAVFLTVINSNMPETSEEVSKFSIYVGLQLFGSACTILVTIISLNLYYKTTKDTIPIVFRALVKLCCLKTSISNISAEKGQVINGYGPNENVDDINQKKRVPEDVSSHLCSWRTVSISLDRLCFVCAILWNAVLVIQFMVSVHASL